MCEGVVSLITRYAIKCVQTTPPQNQFVLERALCSLDQALQEDGAESRPVSACLHYVLSVLSNCVTPYLSKLPVW